MERKLREQMAKQSKVQIRPVESPSAAQMGATAMSDMGGSIRGRNMQTAEERKKKFAAQQALIDAEEKADELEE